MASEELIQSGYLSTGKLQGEQYGAYERFSLGGTSIRELLAAGITATVPQHIGFPFKEYVAPKRVEAAKPDVIITERTPTAITTVAVVEHKRPSDLKTAKQQRKAEEQALHAAAAMSCTLAVVTDGKKSSYVNVLASLSEKKLVYFDGQRSLSPATISILLNGSEGEEKDPQQLAESVWQIIWQATKAEPKECLLTFVEIFVLKFLSDNLSERDLPQSASFYELIRDPADFKRKHGKTAISHYVDVTRPRIKSLFPDNTIAENPAVGDLFGLRTVVSKTSVINGFAFLRSSSDSLNSFDRTFRDILLEFEKFGPLTKIDPEFKLRLYESFLKRSARQSRLGQFFTPRNVVKSIITMAEVGKLKEGAVVLDPAGGVGGFVLEPMLCDERLADNLTFSKGKPSFKINFVGVDLDPNLHILAKANMLLHLAERIREPNVNIPAMNAAMAETFVLMNENETLGSLLNPPQACIDLILTNPPYVTKGSSIYMDEIAALTPRTRNGVDLLDYYDRSGRGIESLFLRYIVGALKPGGRAFVIVPLGLLNRSEEGPKQQILDECNLLASIALPSGTFFNTGQRTHIIVLEKRRSAREQRPPVFCAIARSIGETLDKNRFVEPTNDDLKLIAEAFADHFSKSGTLAKASALIRISPAQDFSAGDRWDVSRFWTSEELTDLGEEKESVSAKGFLSTALTRMAILETKARSINQTSERRAGSRQRKVSIGSADLFSLHAGLLIRDEDIVANPGSIPVLSCFKTPDKEKGRISEEWLRKHGHAIFDTPMVTVNKNGASVGKVFVRDLRCCITQDVISVVPVHRDLDVRYVAIALRRAATKGRFLYEAKLNAKRLRKLEIEVPITDSGDFDLEEQRRIIEDSDAFDEFLESLALLGDMARDVRFDDR